MWRGQSCRSNWKAEKQETGACALVGGAHAASSLSFEVVYIDIFVKVRRLGRSLLSFFLRQLLRPLLCPFLRQLFLQLLTSLFDRGR